MRRTIEVVDDFYRDPYARRERALASTPAVSDGTSARVPGDSGVRAPDAEARARIASLLGYSEASFPELTSRLTFVGADGDGAVAAPHAYDSQWAALVYFALPEDHFSGGVGFYRPVAARSAPGTRGGSAVPGNGGPGDWEETTYVPLTFNRMVLFQGVMAHRYTIRGIDRGPVDDRIAQLFLFDEPNGGQ